ncbi:accessory Sec system protein Asp1 [Enterococcus sp. AZ072]|uniref:accessory Sec system protein Asp1 n=1 Tax=unclassified Enterococcus TaxID=2608891 RepID=UPI003D2C6A3E
MIYLIPNWKQSDNHLENDRMLNIARLFSKNGEKYELLLLNYLPFLRYKAQEYTIFSDRYWRAYDVLQNIHLINGHPLSIEDLELPEMIEKVYTPFGIVLLKEAKMYGEVLYNKYGCIERVKTFENDWTIVDSYDDRGFLSSKEYANAAGKVSKREYFNEFGEKTVIEVLSDTPRVIIGEAGNDLLKEKSYRTITEAISDVLIHKAASLENQKEILTVTENNILEITKAIQDQESMIRIISDNDNLRTFNQSALFEGMKTSKYIVTDTTSKQHELMNIKKANSFLENTSITTIPMFNTELNLGMSNSVVQLIMYWRVGEMNERVYEANEVFVNNLIKHTKHTLVFEVQTAFEMSKLQEQQKELIDSFFAIDSDSEDFKKAEHFIEAKRTKHLYKADEIAVEEIRKKKSWTGLVKAISVYHRIEFRINPTLLSVQNDFQSVRLYIDINQEYNLQMQSLAISAGIPQVVKSSTDYIEDKKNGMVISRISELEDAINYFLKNLNNWNNSLVENVRLIEEYSPHIVMEKWKEVFNG